MTLLKLVTLALCAYGANAFAGTPQSDGASYAEKDWSCFGSVGEVVCTGRIVSNSDGGTRYTLENTGSAGLFYPDDMMSPQTVWEISVTGDESGICTYSIKAKNSVSDYFGIDPHASQDGCQHNMFTGDRSQEDRYTLGWSISTDGYIAHSDDGNWVAFTAEECAGIECNNDGGASCPDMRNSWSFVTADGYTCALPNSYSRRSLRH